MTCTIPSQVQFNDIGTVFRLTILDQDGAVVDVSGASVKKILFQSPGGVLDTQDAEFSDDGSDGQIEYVTVDGDLDETGVWSIQAKVTMVAGTWYSETKTFAVQANLDAA